MTAPDQKKRKKMAMAEVGAEEEISRRWDPIGVQPGIAAPLDEYNRYAPHIVTMVTAVAATTTDLATHLEFIASVTMGVGPSTAAAQGLSRKFAAAIIKVLRPSSGSHK